MHERGMGSTETAAARGVRGQRLAHAVERALAARPVPVAAALLAVLLTLPALRVGWQTDDFGQRNALRAAPGLDGLAHRVMDLFACANGEPARVRALMDAGDFPWWTYDHLRIAFWRPLSAWTHWLDYRLWPDNAALMHAHSLLWFGLAVLIAGAVYRRMLGPTWMAGVAALLFSIDDAHGFAVGWIANRNALLAAACGYLALLLHDGWRRAAWRPGAVLAPLALALALLSGESGVGAWAYVVAYALVLQGGPWRTRLLTLLPSAAVVVAWWCTYHGLGYGAAGSGLYDDAAGNPLRFARLLVERGPFLLVGQWNMPPSDIVYFASAESVRQQWWLTWPQLVLLAALLWPLVRHDRTARFWATGMLLALVPACSALPSDRLLFFVGLGAMGLLAQFLACLIERAPWLPASRRYRWPAGVVALVLLAVHGVRAPLALPDRTASAKLAGEDAAQMIRSLPDDAELVRQDLILVNPPNMYGPGLLTAYRQATGGALPAHLRVLAPGLLSMDLSRPDANTLVVCPRRGFLPPPGVPAEENAYRDPRFNFGYLHQHLARLYRDDAHPLHAGQSVVLTGLTVTVTRLTVDGRPAEAAFRFDVPLEDAGLRWIYATNGEYQPLTPPAVGARLHLSPGTRRAE